MSGLTRWVLGAVFAVVLGICVVGAVLALTSDPDIDVNLGDDEFVLRDVTARAASVAEDGPLVFADPARGTRPLLVHHLGGDPRRGWVAILAIVPGTEACVVDWDAGREAFRDCRGQDYPVDGQGLTTYPTRVEGDDLHVDLGRGH